MTAPLKGRVGIVTGAGKGLGRSFAIDLARAGAKVVVNNRNPHQGAADAVVAEIRAAGGEAVADYDDVTVDGIGDRLVSTALDAFGRLDFLVANAGVSQPEMFHKTTDDRFDAVTAVNVGGTAHIARAVSAHLRGAGGGHIVIVSSTAGLHGEFGASAYSAGKGAAIALGRAIAGEGRRNGVITNVLLPYATTPMTDMAMPDALRDSLDPDLVAPVVTALVDPGCTLDGRVLVTGGGRLRVAAAVEYATVDLDPGPLDPDHLAALVERSHAGEPREFDNAQAAFADLITGLGEPAIDREVN